MKWYAEINWSGTWVRMPQEFPSRDAAEWAIGLWKQSADCTNDKPFRTVPEAA